MFQEIQQTKYCLSKVSSGMLEDKKKTCFRIDLIIRARY